MSAGCITPALLHASRFTDHYLVAESGVSPDDLLVMSQPSLIPAPSPHQERAVRFELTMTGFADRRLNRLGYARDKVWSFVRESNPRFRHGKATSSH
jgi:hypothetical protein